MEILPLATREGTHHSTVAVRFSDHQDQLISMWTTCIAESQVAAGFYVFLPDGFSGLLRPVLGLVARRFSGRSPLISIALPPARERGSHDRAFFQWAAIHLAVG